MGIIAECKQCLQEYDAKRSTSLFCSPKCKQTFYRNRMRPVTVTPVTLTPTVTDASTSCSSGLAGITGKSTPKRGEDIKCFADLPPDVQRAVGPMPADTYARKVPKMTIMERLFYRPAHLLKGGETNFVSLPGRACYGVV